MKMVLQTAENSFPLNISEKCSKKGGNPNNEEGAGIGTFIQRQQQQSVSEATMIMLVEVQERSKT